MQDTIPSQDASLNHLCRVPFPCEVTFSQVSGIKTWTFGGRHYSVDHSSPSACLSLSFPVQEGRPDNSQGLPSSWSQVIDVGETRGL